VSSSVVGKSVRGAAWTITSSIGARLLGLVSTLVLSYFINPDVQGAVSAASIVTLTAGQLTELGLAQYVVAHPKAGADTIFPIFVVHFSLGALGLLLVWLLREPLGHALGAPTMGQYVPGFVLCFLIARVGAVPLRLLIRDLKFRRLGLSRPLAEVTFTVSTIALAMMGKGGMALVYGNIARAVVVAVVIVTAVDPRLFLTPSPITIEKMKPVFRYGVPLSIGGLAQFASRNWDNLAISRLFGDRVLGLYQKAYGFADIPATQVGEQIGDVLLPAFAHMQEEERQRELVRATGFLSLIVFPLAIGLGAVAKTLIAAWLPPVWRDTGPMLLVLSSLSVARPIGWTVSSYLQAANRPRAAMWLGLGQVVFLMGCIFTVGRLGPLWACVAVGLAFGLHSLASLWTVATYDGIPMRRFLARCVPPLLACIPLLVAVGAVHWGLARLGWETSKIAPLIEVVAGALGYLAGAFTVARSMTHELISVIRDARRRRSTAPPAAGLGPTP
jgi:lipopolysaccharide exporter